MKFHVEEHIIGLFSHARLISIKKYVREAQILQISCHISRFWPSIDMMISDELTLHQACRPRQNHTVGPFNSNFRIMFSLFEKIREVQKL